MELLEIASQLNTLAAGTPLGGIQSARRTAKGRAVRGTDVFDTAGKKYPGPYLFHRGGRGEFQFNIGFEESEFRFGLGLSFEPSKFLQQPHRRFYTRLKRLNEIIGLRPDLFQGKKMWSYRNGENQGVHEVRPIASIDAADFWFIGEWVDLAQRDPTNEELRAMVASMNSLWPVYEYVELQGHAEHLAHERKRLARICWNTEGWAKPSGPDGKSADRKSYESQVGFGMEEWLFDWHEDAEGWQYGYLRPISKSRDRLDGQSIDVTLVTRDPVRQRYLLVGQIDDVEVLSLEGSQAAAASVGADHLRKRRQQLVDCGADPSEFDAAILEPHKMFNCRFKRGTVRLDPTKANSIELADDIQEQIGNRYQLQYLPIGLLNEPSILRRASSNGSTQADPQVRSNDQGSNVPDEDTLMAIIERHYAERTVSREDRHGAMQRALHRYLHGRHPGAVFRERGLKDDSWSRVDIALELPTSLVYYEIKTYQSAQSCIRIALGQLMEYAFAGEGRPRPNGLVIVGEHPIDPRSTRLLDFLNSMGLAVSYLQFDIDRAEPVHQHPKE